MFSKRKNQQGFAVEIVLIGIVGVAVIAAAVYFFLVLLPRQQVNNAANAFVETSVDGEYGDLVELAHVENEQEENYVERFGQDIDKGVGSDEYSIRSTEIDGDEATVVFEVDGNEDRTIRLEMKKVDGKWLVQGVFYSLGEAAASGGAPNEMVADAPAPVAAPTACLPAAALEEFWRYKHGWQFYFQADSNELEFSETTALTSVAQMKEFYDKNSQYNFTFEIDVSLYQATGSASDVQLAKDRAGVVAYNMNRNGIPYEYIRFGEAISAGSPDTPEYATGSRNATVAINASCDAQSTPQDFNANNVGR